MANPLVLSVAAALKFSEPVIVAFFERVSPMPVKVVVIPEFESYKLTPNNPLLTRMYLYSVPSDEKKKYGFGG